MEEPWAFFFWNIPPASASTLLFFFFSVRLYTNEYSAFERLPTHPLLRQQPTKKTHIIIFALP